MIDENEKSLDIETAGQADQSGDYSSLPNNTKPYWWLDKGYVICPDRGYLFELRSSLRKLALFQFVGYAGTINNGYDGSLMNGRSFSELYQLCWLTCAGLLANPAFENAIDNVSGQKLGLLQAAYPLGGLLAFQLAAWFSDRFGRKSAIFAGALISIAAAVIQTSTRGPWVLFGGRLLLGIGTAFEVVAAPTLVVEITHPRNRSQASALTQTCYYSAFSTRL